MGRKVSLSTFSLQRVYGDRRALEIAAAVGADAVDFSLDTEDRFDYRNPESVYSKSEEEFVAYFLGLKQLADQLGIAVCMTHGRGAGFRDIPEEDEALVENARLDCYATKLLGAPVCVIHAVTTIWMTPQCPPQRMRDLNFTMFSRLLPFARQYGIQIATETFGDAVMYDACDFFGNIDEFADSFERICAAEDFRDHFTVCVDTGHSNKASRFGNPKAGDVIRRMGKSVTALHLNDNDTLTDQHKIPLTGSIDWADVLDALDEIGYAGFYNMELTLSWFGQELMVESAAFAVKVMKNLLRQRYG